MSSAQVIDKLNECLRWEWTGLAQYAQHSFIVSGPWREVYSEMFRDGAEECFKHARRIGEKIVAMGGVPTVEREPIVQSDDLDEMLRANLEFERTAVKRYSETLDLVADDHALRVLIEDMILEEQDGVDHLERILRDKKLIGGPTAARKSG